MYDLIGLGNALVDIEIPVSEEKFNSLGVVKNSMTLISLEQRDDFLQKLKENARKISSGGAVCNTLCGLAKQGHQIGMIGFVGGDAYGEKYLKDLKQQGIDFLGSVTSKATGTSIVLITPDHNRTMLTTLGCASDLEDQILETIVAKESKWINRVLIEGYLLLGSKNIGKIRKMVQQLKTKEVMVLLSDSDAFCVEQERSTYAEFFKLVDVFFTNGEQAKAMKNLDRLDPTDVRLIGEDLSSQTERPQLLIVTDSDQGAYIAQDELIHIPAIPTQVVDATGAGDAFAAGVIDGLIREKSPKEMGELGTKMASAAISSHGARSYLN